jgi:hypothetical protein
VDALVTMTIWFGEAPGAGKSIVLPPGGEWHGAVANKSGLFYKSSLTGGQISYVLRGVAPS